MPTICCSPVYHLLAAVTLSTVHRLLSTINPLLSTVYRLLTIVCHLTVYCYTAYHKPSTVYMTPSPSPGPICTTPAQPAQLCAASHVLLALLSDLILLSTNVKVVALPTDALLQILVGVLYASSECQLGYDMPSRHLASAGTPVNCCCYYYY